MAACVVRSPRWRAEVWFLGFVCLTLLICRTADASPASDFNDELKRYQQLEQQGRYLDAVRSMERMLQIAERSLSDQPELIGNCLNNLGAINQSLGRYEESEKYYKRALPLYQRLFGANSQYVIDVTSNLAIVYKETGRYDESESLLLRALAAQKRISGPSDPHLANQLNSLGALYHSQGRAAESEALYRQSLAIREKILRSDDPSLAMSYANLGATLNDQGNFAAAEPLMKRSLAILEKAYGPNHPDIATTLNNLASLYADQGRYTDAEKLHRRTLAIREKSLGADHPSVAMSLYNLANVLNEKEAEPLVRRALEIFRAAYGPHHPDVAFQLNALANYADNRGDAAQAEELHKQALQIRETALGPNHSDVVVSLNNLALIYESQRRYDDALPLVERSLQILERRNLPDFKLKLLQFRARLEWETGEKDAAVRDVTLAMSIAEQLRGQASGREMDAARHFSQYSSAFEQMTAYHLALRNIPEAFQAAERGRGRALLDQMQLQGEDLLAAIPEPEAKALRQRESDARRRIATLDKQISVLASNDAVSDDEYRTRSAPLRKELDAARTLLVDVQREIHNTSPAYRMTVTSTFEPIALSTVQSWLAGQHALALQYVLGAKASYLFELTPDGALRSFDLFVSDSDASRLNLEAGPLTIEKLRQALDTPDGYLLDMLADPKRNPKAQDLLAALWPLLIPADIRERIVSRQDQRIIIVPDGPLSLLPFDTLIVEPGDDPKYLLDVGPPIVYAPSATVLYNLATREQTPLSGKRKPVLTVGDPVYAAAGPQPGASALDELTPRSRYSKVGGPLKPLPNTGTESDWLMQNFSKQNITVGQLKRELATEDQVRYNLNDRKIIHLACHGLVDQEYGNLFGALALTPGKQKTVNPDDDGFLTLPEIYNLDLKSCELAILSACDTNYGPQQKGEGVWALSRGFVVAGARRVVASNWLVDDDSAASLISYFAGGIAADEGKSQPVDYATRLQQAKRWVRQQEKWSSPFYWGTFVLVGPN